MAAKSGQAWANGDPLTSLALTIIAETSDDVFAFLGIYQSVVMVEGFDITTVDEEGEPQVVGTWSRTTTTTHYGDKAIGSVDDYSVSRVVEEDDAPTDPDHFVEEIINYEKSSVDVGGEVLDYDLQLKAETLADAGGWKEISDSLSLGPLSAGWSGIWSSAATQDILGTVIISRVRFQPKAFVLGDISGGQGFYVGSDMADGALSVPIAWTESTYDWAEEENTNTIKSAQLPWRKADRIFARHAPNDPTDWITLPYGSDSAKTVSIIQPTGDLWPLIRSNA